MSERAMKGVGSQNGHQALYISSHQPTRGRFSVFNLFYHFEG